MEDSYSLSSPTALGMEAQAGPSDQNRWVLNEHKEYGYFGKPSDFVPDFCEKVTFYGFLELLVTVT